MQKLCKDFKDYHMTKIHIVYTEELGNKERILEPKDYAKEQYNIKHQKASN